MIEGDITGFTTSSTVVNGVVGKNHRRYKVSSLNVDVAGVVSVHTFLMTRLRDKFVRRLGQALDAPSEAFEMAKLMAAVFTKRPVMEGAAED